VAERGGEGRQRRTNWHHILQLKVEHLGTKIARHMKEPGAFECPPKSYQGHDDALAGLRTGGTG
jgi:hypothetical protein